MTTDTPRTDGLWANGNTGEDELDALCRQLERELAEAEAEVERLRKILKQFTEGSELALDAIQQSGRWCFEPQADPRRILKEALLELNPTDK